MIEPYIVDFYCHEIGLVIELDGSQHGTDDAMEYDAERTKFLEALGLRVVRYWNNEVLLETDDVLDDLWKVCLGLKVKTPLPNPHLRLILKQCFKTCSGEGISLLNPCKH